jgi:hypothetical protein
MTPLDAMAATIGGQRYRLPEGAVALGTPPVVLPLPGAAPPLLGLAAHGGDVLPVFAPAAGPDGPACWAWVPLPAPWLLGVDALAGALPGDAALPQALVLPGAARRAAATILLPEAGAARPTRHRAAGQAAALRLGLGGAAGIDLPMGCVLQVVPRQLRRPLPPPWPSWQLPSWQRPF